MRHHATDNWTLARCNPLQRLYTYSFIGHTPYTLPSSVTRWLKYLFNIWPFMCNVKNLYHCKCQWNAARLFWLKAFPISVDTELIMLGTRSKKFSGRELEKYIYRPTYGRNFFHPSKVERKKLVQVLCAGIGTFIWEQNKDMPKSDTNAYLNMSNSFENIDIQIKMDCGH